MEAFKPKKVGWKDSSLVALSGTEKWQEVLWITDWVERESLRIWGKWKCYKISAVVIKCQLKESTKKK